MTHDRNPFSPGNEVLTFGPFRLDPVQRVLLEADQPRRLGSRAIEILFALAERAGQIVSKNELIARVWPDSIVQEATLRVHIAALRKVLGDGKSGIRYVENFSGRGYRLVAQVKGLNEVRSSPTAAGAMAAAAPVSAECHAGNLPCRLGRVIGRAQVIATLAARMRQRRFVTLVGPGGIGKTTVALAIADKLTTVCQHGARFIDLASLTDLKLVVSTLASGLGLAMLPEDPLPGILTFLKDKQMLIVLDNCEHVIEAAAGLAEEVLRGAPEVHLLATSREPLRAESEYVHRLAPLEAPPASSTLSSAEALVFPAIQFFVERATANVDTFVLHDADVPIVAEICRRLDGNPLAIELAAARMDLFGPRALAARLDDGLQLLTRGRRTALSRHQTLRATLDWSYELLSPAEQIALRRLAVFVGSFCMDGAAKVLADEQIRAADVFDILANLVHKSLVVVDVAGEQALYRLLDTLRAYALEKLRDSGELATIKLQRHAHIWCKRGAADRFGSGSPCCA